MNEFNDNIVLKETDGIRYIQFKKLLEFGVKHAYTLRGTDFGHACPTSQESYKKLCDALGLDSKNLINPYQQHTDIVVCIDKYMTTEELTNLDGVITDNKELVLSAKNADCIIFLLYDPVKKVIGNIHSGWRGTFKKILEKGIVKLINNYKCDPKDIYCFISPSIRKCHFEVDEDVAELCKEIFGFTGKTDEFISLGDIKEGKQKYYIDTVEINKILMKDLGIEEDHIIDSELCSLCRKDILSSYRADGKNFERATGIISLKGC